MNPSNNLFDHYNIQNNLRLPAYFSDKKPNIENASVPSKQPYFIETLRAQININLSDTSLDVHRLTRLVGMSRSDLHRKLRRHTGMSTTEYMRHIRLQKAAELLLSHPGWSVYQVALEVGFSSQGYFSRRFKEVFGMCPAEWRAVKGELEHM